MVLADAKSVFGVMEEERREVALRSHGSLHVAAVPLWAWRTPFFQPRGQIRHLDAVRAVMDGFKRGNL